MCARRAGAEEICHCGLDPLLSGEEFSLRLQVLDPIEKRHGSEQNLLELAVLRACSARKAVGGAGGAPLRRPYAALRGSLRFSKSRGRYGSIFPMSAERAIGKIAPSLLRLRRSNPRFLRCSAPQRRAPSPTHSLAASMVVRRRSRSSCTARRNIHLAVSGVCAGPAVEAPPDQGKACGQREARSSSFSLRLSERRAQRIASSAVRPQALP